MALEFNCPYCKATIRVPDNTAGKRGRCPSCATKLTIPKFGQTRRAGEEQPFFPGPPDPASVVPSEPSSGDDVIFEEFDPAQTAGIDSELQASLPPGDIALPDLGGTVMPTLPPPVRQLPDSLLSKSRARRRTPGWVWVVILILIVGGGGAAGGIYWVQQQSTLTGEFDGQLVDNPPMPASVVPRSMIELPPGDAAQVFDDLERNPRTLSSTVGLATVIFQGAESGLLVSVSPGAATSLYRVEILGDKKLQKHLRDHGKEYERARRESLSVAVNEMFRVIKRSLKATKKAAAHDLREFRDSVGFAAQVQGLGHFVAAAHRQQIYPCVYEDDEALYFLLPSGSQSFQIRGKPSKRGEPFFRGVYDVEVTGSVQLRHDEESETKSPKEKSPKKEAMTEEGDEM